MRYTGLQLREDSSGEECFKKLSFSEAMELALKKDIVIQHCGFGGGLSIAADSFARA
jgi:hypothetical protein